MAEDKEPIEQLHLASIVNEIREKYVPARSLLETDEMITIGQLRIRVGAVPMFGSQQSDPLVSIIRELERGEPSFQLSEVPGTQPSLLLKKRMHKPTTAELAMRIAKPEHSLEEIMDAMQSKEYTDYEETES